MSRDAEEFYRRENQKARDENTRKAMAAAGALAGLAASGVSKIFGHFAAKKQEKVDKKFAELSEALAKELGIEDTGTLSKQFETDLVSIASKLLTSIARRTNRLNGEKPEGFITAYCFFGINYSGSDPFATLAPMVIESFSESVSELPAEIKRQEYWEELVDIIHKEYEEIKKSDNEIDFKSIIKSKTVEFNNWRGNQNLSIGVFYSAVSYLMYPKGELNPKTTRLLQEIFPLLGLDEDSAQEIVDDAESNFEANLNYLKKKFMRTPLFMTEAEENP